MFGRRRETPDLRRRVQELQVLALQNRIPGGAAAPLNQAGDLLLASGDVYTAVEMYGRAVDALVEADRFEAGIALCRKIIRTLPVVVRARCTLSWLAIGAGFTAQAAASVGDYVAAAELAGREDLALEHVQWMGTVVDLPELRLHLAEYLLYLGADETSDQLFGAVYAERNGAAPRTVDAERRLQDVRKAALLGPRRLAGAMG